MQIASEDLGNVLEGDVSFSCVLVRRGAVWCEVGVVTISLRRCGEMRGGERANVNVDRMIFLFFMGASVMTMEL